jgi:hypothetical protein
MRGRTRSVQTGPSGILSSIPSPSKTSDFAVHPLPQLDRGYIVNYLCPRYLLPIIKGSKGQRTQNVIAPLVPGLHKVRVEGHERSLSPRSLGLLGELNVMTRAKPFQLAPHFATPLPTCVLLPQPHVFSRADISQHGR